MMKRWPLLLIFLAAPLHAVPLVSSVTSTATVKGTSVTVNGSGFGTKSPALPLAWQDFENGSANPSPKGQRLVWDADSTSFVVITSGTQYGDSVRMGSGIIGPENVTFPGSHSKSFRLDLIYWTTVYMSIDRRRDFASSVGLGNIKMWRLWIAGGSDYVASSDQGGIAFNECDTLYPSRYSGALGISWAANTWDHERFIWTHGTNVQNPPASHTGDGTMDYWQNGKNIIHQTDVPNCLNTHEQLRVADNFCSADADCPAAGQVFEDNIYIDNTFSRVEISTSATYGTSTNLKPLLLQQWSSTQIVGELFIGDIAPSSTLYAYVTDAQNNTNSAGVQITASGSMGSNAPSAETRAPVRR